MCIADICYHCLPVVMAENEVVNWGFCEYFSQSQEHSDYCCYESYGCCQCGPARDAARKKFLEVLKKEIDAL